MARDTMSDLTAFLAVARERSFTRAAGQLGLSPSALSHTIRGLEERLGVRLLTRTTRSVSPTEAGERLLRTIGPHFDEIRLELDALTEFRDKPAGTIRIVAGDHPAETVLWPAIAKLLPQYPDIKVEICIDNAFTDIVADRFDAGVRLGEAVAKDMIAVRIGADLRWLAVASPEYLSARPIPVTPHQLAEQQCINQRRPSLGGFYAWEFEKDGRELKVRVEGQLAFDRIDLIRQAALAGFGIAFLPADYVEPHIADARLVPLLEDWSAPWPGYHLYYPSRRQESPAFRLLIETLRYRD
ncbi:LysR family transcriptional regulator [Caulobacter rhizosphaerae]|jgi:DNA-binding transcriptional LysR family regulator|uniref:LysR family transcriptional regulator n=1 Tax=Caulobacter rhizosphaerae TaxID=2010972 RepID=UPI0013D3974A|nr:LysR family transcriptional regulator [Caulobacter rhizosphaerae]GGL10025.1 LysR family transcriptional regulator [Caulobacter rhizosphaerae]